MEVLNFKKGKKNGFEASRTRSAVSDLNELFFGHENIPEWPIYVSTYNHLIYWRDGGESKHEVLIWNFHDIFMELFNNYYNHSLFIFQKTEILSTLVTNKYEKFEIGTNSSFNETKTVRNFKKISILNESLNSFLKKLK